MQRGEKVTSGKRLREKLFKIIKIASVLLFLNLADHCVSADSNAFTSLYVGVASMINEANRSNHVIPQMI